MHPFASPIRRNVKPLAAALIVASLFLALKISLAVDDAEVNAAAARFKFSRSVVSEVAGPPARFQRRVHPSVRRISSFLSTVGAAVALNDLDGDGLSNDVCYIDTRTDQIVVAPVKSTGDRGRRPRHVPPHLAAYGSHAPVLLCVHRGLASRLRPPRESAAKALTPLRRWCRS